MKKLFTLIVTASLCFGAMAQGEKLPVLQKFEKLKQRNEMKREMQQRKAPRIDFKQFNFAPGSVKAPKSGAKAYNNQWVTQMPTNRWFPGEWEEVQAIVVNFPYDAYPANHVGDENYAAQMFLPGQGVLYQYNSNSGGYSTLGWGDVKGVPNTTDYTSQMNEYISYYNGMMNQSTYQQYQSMLSQYYGITSYDGFVQYLQEQIEDVTVYYTGLESFRNVFLNLIEGVQQQAQVWIAIWDLADSTTIKNFMTSIGKPLTNYRFIECYSDAFWYRDCGPICFYYGDNDDVAMLNFSYSGRACDDLLPDSISSQTGIPVYTTDIEWEGGNCLVDGAGTLVTSDATYDENADTYGQVYYTGQAPYYVDYRNKTALSSSVVDDSMRFMIADRNLYVLPRLNYDGGTGHVDLYADMWDENEFIFSQYPAAYSSWSDNTVATTNINTLTGYQSIFGANYKKTYIPFPSKDDGSNFASQLQYDTMYTRSYSNHTFINNMIIQPCFSEVVNGEPSASWDKANLEQVKAAYPGYTIYPIDIRSFDGYGGAIHCITKQIPAENPVRILHKSTTRHDGTQEGKLMDMSATVTNRSGIANVTVYWRSNGGQWHTVALNAGSNNVFNGTIDFSQAGLAENEQGVIEYYISATSNNGKTITKPMTASQGGYYTFDLNYKAGHNVGIEQVLDERFGQFYPNPARNQARIAINGDASYQVSVVDAMGRTVSSERVNADNNGTYTIDLSGMANGIYSVRFVANNGKSVTRRLIVQ